MGVFLICFYSFQMETTIYVCRWCENEPQFVGQMPLVQHLTDVHKVFQLSVYDLSVFEQSVNKDSSFPDFRALPSSFTVCSSATNSQRMTAGAFAGANYIESQLNGIQTVIRNLLMHGVRVGVSAALDVIKLNSTELSETAASNAVLLESSDDSSEEEKEEENLPVYD